MAEEPKEADKTEETPLERNPQFLALDQGTQKEINFAVNNDRTLTPSLDVDRSLLDDTEQQQRYLDEYQQGVADFDTPAELKPAIEIQQRALEIDQDRTAVNEAFSAGAVERAQKGDVFNLRKEGDDLRDLTPLEKVGRYFKLPFEKYRLRENVEFGVPDAIYENYLIPVIDTSNPFKPTVSAMSVPSLPSVAKMLPENGYLTPQQADDLKRRLVGKAGIFPQELMGEDLPTMLRSPEGLQDQVRLISSRGQAMLRNRAAKIVETRYLTPIDSELVGENPENRFLINTMHNLTKVSIGAQRTVREALPTVGDFAIDLAAGAERGFWSMFGYSYVPTGDLSLQSAEAAYQKWYDSTKENIERDFGKISQMDEASFATNLGRGIGQLAIQIPAGALLSPLKLGWAAFALTGAGLGGAMFYQEREQYHLNKGTSPEEAKEKALVEGMAAAGLIYISEQVTGGLGRLINRAPILGDALINNTQSWAAIAVKSGLRESFQESTDMLMRRSMIQARTADPEEMERLYGPEFYAQLKEAGLIAFLTGGAGGRVTSTFDIASMVPLNVGDQVVIFRSENGKLGGSTVEVVSDDATEVGDNQMRLKDAEKEQLKSHRIARARIDTHRSIFGPLGDMGIRAVQNTRAMADKNTAMAILRSAKNVDGEALYSEAELNQIEKELDEKFSKANKGAAGQKRLKLSDIFGSAQELIPAKAEGLLMAMPKVELMELAPGLGHFLLQSKDGEKVSEAIVRAKKMGIEELVSFLESMNNRQFQEFKTLAQESHTRVQGEIDTEVQGNHEAAEVDAAGEFEAASNPSESFTANLNYLQQKLEDYLIENLQKEPGAAQVEASTIVANMAGKGVVDAEALEIMQEALAQPEDDGAARVKRVEDLRRKIAEDKAAIDRQNAAEETEAEPEEEEADDGDIPMPFSRAEAKGLVDQAVEDAKKIQDGQAPAPETEQEQKVGEAIEPLNIDRSIFKTLLQRLRRKQGKNTRIVEAPNEEAARLQQGLEDAGIKVVFIDGTDKAFAGVYIDGTGVIGIHVNSVDGPKAIANFNFKYKAMMFDQEGDVKPSTALMNAIASHEIVHHLKTQDPKAYKELYKAFLRNDPEGLLNGMALAILMESDSFVKLLPDHPISGRIKKISDADPDALSNLVGMGGGRDIIQLTEIEARQLFRQICELQAEGNQLADLLLDETLSYTVESAAIRDSQSNQDVLDAVATNTDIRKSKTIVQRVRESLFGLPDDATLWQTRGKWEALFDAFQAATPVGPGVPESVQEQRRADRRQQRIEEAAKRLQEGPFGLVLSGQNMAEVVPIPATTGELFSRIDGLQEAEPDFAIYTRGKTVETNVPLPPYEEIYGRVDKYTRRIRTPEEEQLLKSRDDLIGRTGYAVATLSQDPLVPQAINEYRQSRRPQKGGSRAYEESLTRPVTPNMPSEPEKYSASLEPLDETNRTPDAKVIYYAENAKFDSFNAKKNNTSRHHFFTSDLTTAQEAGESVIEYRLNGSVADFTQENRKFVEEAQLRRAYIVGEMDSYFDTVEEFIEVFDQGMLHQHLGNSKALDDAVSALLIVSKSPIVRIPDVGRDGKLIDAYVTRNMPIKYRGEQTGKTFSINYRVQTKTESGRKMSEMGMVLIQANDEFEAREEFKRRNKRSDEFKDKMYRTLDSGVVAAMMDGFYPKPRVVISTVSEVDEHTPRYSRTGSDEATTSRSFKRYFDGTNELFKNADGSPKAFFHGTDVLFDQFNLAYKTAESNDQFGAGFYFTADEKVARSYSRRAISNKMRDRGEDPNAAVLSDTFPPLQIYKVYLAVKNPIRLNQDEGSFGPDLTRDQVRQIVMKGDTSADGPMSNYGDIEYDGLESVMSSVLDAYENNPNAFYQLEEFFGDQQEYLRALNEATGFDGVYVAGEQGDVAVAFFPEQIKSVDDNSGNFDPDDPRMNFSRFADLKGAVEETAPKVKNALKKSFKERILSTRGLPAGVVRQFVEKDGMIDVHADRAAKANRRLMSEVRKKFSSREERNTALRAANELLALPPEVARQHPAARLLGREITEIVADMNNHIQAMSQRVIDELGFSDKMKTSIADNLGFYVHKRYKAFTDPKWAERVPREVKEQFKRVIRQQLREQLEASKKEPRTIIRDGRSVPNPAFRTEEMIEAELDQLVQDILFGAQEGGSVMAFASKLGSGKRTSNIFKKRKLVLIDRAAEVDKLDDEHATRRDRLDKRLADGKISKEAHSSEVENLEAELQAAKDKLTPENVKQQNDFVEAYKALLGEIEDPISNYAETIKKMSVVLAENRLANAILRFIFDTPPPGRTDLVKLDFIEGVEFKKRRHMVPLQGKYITRDAKDALDLMLGRNGGVRDSSVIRMFLTMNATIKFGKTVLSPTTQVRNVVGNLPFLIANGYFDLLTGGVPLVQAFRESGITAGVGNDLLSLAGKDRAKFAEKYQRLLELGVVRTSNLAEVEGMLEDSRGKTLEELMSGLGRVGGVLNSAQRLYKAEDDIFKILAFEIEFSRLKDAYGDGSNDAQLETEAAEIVANTMPNYDKVPEIIKTLRVIPFIGTFPSFTAEVIRTQIGRFSQTQRELKSENAKIRSNGKKRLAGSIMQGVLLPTVLAEIFKAFSGVSDEEERAVRNMLPEWNRNSVLLFVRDENDEVTFIDYGYVDPLVYFRKPLIALMNRDTNLTTGVGEAFRDILSPFMGEEIGFGAIKQALDGKDRNGRSIVDPGAGALEAGYDRAMHFLTAAQPGFIPQFRDLYYGMTGYVNDYGKRYEFGNQAATMLTGFKTETVNIPQAFGFKVAEFARLDRELRTRMNQVVRTQGRVSEKDLEEAVENYNDKRHELQVRLFDQVRGMRRLGLSEIGIRRILRGNFISQDLTNDLVNGRFQSYDIRPTLLDRQLEQLKFTDRDVPLTKPGEVQRRLNILRQATKRLEPRRLDD